MAALRRGAGRSPRAVGRGRANARQPLLRRKRQQPSAARWPRHDPHRRPGPAERVEHHARAASLRHETRACAHFEPDRRGLPPGRRAVASTTCGPPGRGARDVAHTATTDHRIPLGDGRRGSHVPWGRGGVADPIERVWAGRGPGPSGVEADRDQDRPVPRSPRTVAAGRRDRPGPERRASVLLNAARRAARRRARAGGEGAPSSGCGAEYRRGPRDAWAGLKPPRETTSGSWKGGGLLRGPRGDEMRLSPPRPRRRGQPVLCRLPPAGWPSSTPEAGRWPSRSGPARAALGLTFRSSRHGSPLSSRRPGLGGGDLAAAGDGLRRLRLRPRRRGRPLASLIRRERRGGGPDLSLSV